MSFKYVDINVEVKAIKNVSLSDAKVINNPDWYFYEGSGFVLVCFGFVLTVLT